MIRNNNVSIIVLAGGLGTRLGGNKLLLQIGDQTLLERAIDAVSSLSDERILVLAQGQTLEVAPGKNIRIVHDIYPEKGALGGLHAGLDAASRERCAVVAGDMPFINAELLRELLRLADGYNAVVPEVGGKIHPLHAVYNRACFQIMQSQIEKGDLRVTNLLAKLRVLYVDEVVVDKIDPQHLSLFNVNTQADLKRARKLAACRPPSC